MEKYGPSSVTVEEAVAKMIGFKWIPEGVTLEEFLEAILSDTLDTCFENQSNAPSADETRQSWVEYYQCVELLGNARRYLRDIESCVNSKDPLLEVALTDTVKTRLTTRSVANWASQRHGIEIPEWQVYRGEDTTEFNDTDISELEGEILFRAIAGLTNELLSRDWKCWNAPPPFNRRPSSYKYFLNDRPAIERIKEDFLKAFDLSDGSEKGWRTVRDRLQDAIDYLKGEKKLTSISHKARPIAQKTLLGLFHLLNKTHVGKSYSNGVVENSETAKLVDAFKYSLHYVRPEELVSCIEEARHIGITKGWA